MAVLVLRCETLTSTHFEGIWFEGCGGACAGDPNCVHIPGLTLEADHIYTLVVSDKDDLDAVLPVGVVRSLLARTLF